MNVQIPGSVPAKCIAFFVIGVLWAASAHADRTPVIEQIQVFTQDADTVDVPAAVKDITQVMDLDDYANQKRYISALIKKAPEQTQSALLDLMDRKDIKIAIEQMTQSADQIIKAWNLNIKSLPTTVINEKFVIEGVDHIRTAIQHFEANVSAQGNKP